MGDHRLIPMLNKMLYSEKYCDIAAGRLLRLEGTGAMAKVVPILKWTDGIRSEAVIFLIEQYPTSVGKEALKGFISDRESFKCWEETVKRAKETLTKVEQVLAKEAKVVQSQ